MSYTSDATSTRVVNWITIELYLENAGSGLRPARTPFSPTSILSQPLLSYPAYSLGALFPKESLRTQLNIGIPAVKNSGRVAQLVRALH